MTRTGSDANDIYERIQGEYSKENLDQQTIIEWLKKGIRRSAGYNPATTSNLERFSKDVEDLVVKDLKSEISSAINLKDFKSLDRIKIDRIQDDVRRKRETVEKQLVQEVKTATERNNFKTAVEELRQLNPQRLGGIKSGETRRAKAGFRVIFR